MTLETCVCGRAYHFDRTNFKGCFAAPRADCARRSSEERRRTHIGALSMTMFGRGRAWAYSKQQFTHLACEAHPFSITIPSNSPISSTTILSSPSFQSNFTGCSVVIDQTADG